MNTIMNTPVAIATGATREEAVRAAIGLVRDELLAKLHGRVAIKPNFLSSVHELSSTLPGAVRPVMELLADAADVSGIVIAEGGSRSTPQALDNFGYRPLMEEYGAEAVDLNHCGFSRSFPIITGDRRRQYAEYGDALEEFDCVVSVPVAKTHDTATVTLSVKNMMGCLRRVHRPRMHGIALSGVPSQLGEWLWDTVEGHPLVLKSFSGVVFTVAGILRSRRGGGHNHGGSTLLRHVGAMSENVARMATVLMPDAAVIDAFEAMEGDGPGQSGTPVDMRIAVAGPDPVACDTIMADLMGFGPEDIGWLALCGERGLGVTDRDRIEVRGENPDKVRRHFLPHTNFPIQRRWRDAWAD
jgi:uncharacterized protein (DUF362 family)